MVDRGKVGKGRACRGLVSGEIDPRREKKRKGSLHSGSALESIHRKTSNPLGCLLDIFHGKICRVLRTVSARSRWERRDMMESRGMPDASPIENTGATTLFLSFILLPSCAYKCVLRIIRGKEGNRRNEIAPCTRNRPSRSANPLARLSPVSIEYSKLSSRKKLSYPPWRVCRQAGKSGSVSSTICGLPRQFGEAIFPLRILRFFKTSAIPGEITQPTFHLWKRQYSLGNNILKFSLCF